MRKMKSIELPIIVFLLAVCLFLSSCRPEQFTVPTITPTPIRTISSTLIPTQIPTLIPTQTLSPTPTISSTATALSKIEVPNDMQNLGSEFCNEKKSIPESAAYDPKSPRPPIIICDLTNCWPISNYLIKSVGTDLTIWTPGSINDLQLILCNRTNLGRTKKGNCYYTSEGGKSISVSAYQAMNYYDLYEAKTGKKLKSFGIPGDDVVSCPLIMASNSKQILGNPDNSELFKQLSASLRIPIPTPTPPVFSLECEAAVNIDQGFISGSWNFSILGEEYDRDNKFTFNDVYKNKDHLKTGVEQVIVVDETLFYNLTKHTYTIKGFITVSSTDPKMIYDVTVTGGAFKDSPQRCTYP